MGRSPRDSSGLPLLGSIASASERRSPGGNKKGRVQRPFEVTPPGVEPGLFCSRGRRVASYTKGHRCMSCIPHLWKYRRGIYPSGPCASATLTPERFPAKSPSPWTRLPSSASSPSRRCSSSTRSKTRSPWFILAFGFGCVSSPPFTASCRALGPSASSRRSGRLLAVRRWYRASRRR